MKPNEKQQAALRDLPGVDYLLGLTRHLPEAADIPKSVWLNAIRTVLDRLRNAVIHNSDAVPGTPVIMEYVKQLADDAMRPNLQTVVNATGVVVHTNLGRSCLSEAAVRRLTEIGRAYSNLEFNIAKGNRGIRYAAVEPLICEITGAEAAMAVNNNAGAVLLCLDTLAHNREAIVSRGELVEIGGSFRIPDVMAKSGAILKEVGTTNRTHPRDYENAVSENTGLFLKVHTSNFSVVGFTAAVSLSEMVAMGKRFDIPVMEDLGSGTFIDFSQYGLSKEPTVQESVAAGVDVITFSGDKLLGGPQAGIIVGKKPILEKIKQNPLTRALRIDKMTLAALEATLRLYRDPEKAVREIPTLSMLLRPLDMIVEKAETLATMLTALADDRLGINLSDTTSKTGGGALPLMDLPSRCVKLEITGLSANTLENRMRTGMPSVIGRIEEDTFLMDARTLKDADLPVIRDRISAILENI